MYFVGDSRLIASTQIITTYWYIHILGSCFHLNMKKKRREEERKVSRKNNIKRLRHLLYKSMGIQ